MTSTRIRIANTIAELRECVRELRQDNTTIGVVPTMGALHAGHVSLVEECKKTSDATIVTIFVNPAQFSPDEDLASYPRPMEDDLQLLTQAGADLVFAPTVEEIYPEGCTTLLKPPAVARALEGASRPEHFAGVATVVLKLFNITGAEIACFGQKDYQQSLVVKQLVRDLHLPIEIVVCPIIREADGLALSSRNVFLSDEERTIALSLNRTLQEATELVRQGEIDGRAIMAHMTQELIEAGVTETDYAVVADPETLEIMETVRQPAVLLLAARIGKTRLIDNRII